MADLVAALDQGTTSTRCILYDLSGGEVGRAQAELRQHFPRPGLVEHDPAEILQAARAVIAEALAATGASAADLAALGIANQRETVVVWDPRSGRPLHNAIVWQDTRTAAAVRALEESGAGTLVRARTGLVPATYFSALKIAWILDNVEGARAAAERGRARCGTVDSWLAFGLSGGGLHVTDVTNASRTMLMDLATLAFDDELLGLFGIPPACLAEIRPSADRHGEVDVAGGRVALTALVGDQQAAMLGQGCVAPGDAKCTYGTGGFLLVNTGGAIPTSRHGLLATVSAQQAGAPATYALEGAVAVAGAAVTWLRDGLGIISDARETAALAAGVADTAGLYFVPAFGGLFAPHWRPDARGVLVGLTAAHGRAHVVRAALEAIAFQVADLLDAVADDLGAPLGELRVDGGVAANDVFLQIQADVLGLPVRRAATTEATALGAARAAALGAGLRPGGLLGGASGATTVFTPGWTASRREDARRRWSMALERSLGWAEPDPRGAP